MRLGDPYEEHKVFCITKTRKFKLEKELVRLKLVWILLVDGMHARMSFLDRLK